VDNPTTDSDPADSGAASQVPFAAAFANLASAALIVDARQPDYPLVFVNTAFTTTTGYAEHEVVGRSCQILTHPEATPALSEPIQIAIDRRQPYKCTLTYSSKNGTLIRNRLTASPVYDVHGQVTHVVCLCEDITAEHEELEALKQRTRHLDHMISSVPGMMFRLLRRPAGVIEYVYVSEACHPLFGVLPEQFLNHGIRLRDLVHPDDLPSFNERWALSRDASAPADWRGRCVLPTGEVKYVQALAFPEPE